ncbi:MAG: EboA domain-containing protein [Ginsengibacter sp.]
MISEENKKTNADCKIIFETIIEKNTSQQAFEWLREKNLQSNPSSFNMAFSSIPRKTGKHELHIDIGDQQKLEKAIPGFGIEGFTIDRLSRIWLLMHLDDSDKKNYTDKIETLFSLAEMNESVALYSALPFLSFFEEWKSRCSEGIRSNIGTVLEAIMYHNPYPAQYLDETAWNQLIMKAFFTDKDVTKITGLDDRKNKNLADTVFDYIRERWAAQRSANIQLWRLVGKYIDESNFNLIEKLFNDKNDIHKKAALLACAGSSYEPAKRLLENDAQLKTEIENDILNWDTLTSEI